VCVFVTLLYVPAAISASVTMSSADNQQAAVDDLVSVQQQLFNLDEDGNDSNDAGIPPFPADG